MRLGRKSQIALFIILGIILVAIIVYFAFLRQASEKKITGQEITELGAVQEFAQKCIDQSARDAVKFTGYEGGYYSNFNISFYDELGDNMFVIPYYFVNNTGFVPKKETVESSISQWFNELLIYCTGDFADFKGISIIDRDPETKVSISGNTIMLTINYPITIKKGDSTAQIEKFNAQVDAEIMPMVYAAGDYIAAQKEFPGTFMMSLLEEIAGRNGLAYTNSFFEDERRVMVTLIKNDSVFGEPFELRFGLGYEKE